MGAVRKRFERPDETREIPDGVIVGVELAEAKAARLSFQPGWRWSEKLKPIVGGDSCQAHHVGYALSGTFRVATADGQEIEISAGDVYEIPPGHDGWVVGGEPFEALEFDNRTAETFAKPE
jgi:quercetin dioxygenase-like cupin family protein